MCAVVMTVTHEKDRDQRSLGSTVRVQTNGQMDRISLLHTAIKVKVAIKGQGHGIEDEHHENEGQGHTSKSRS